MSKSKINLVDSYTVSSVIIKKYTISFGEEEITIIKRWTEDEYTSDYHWECEDIKSEKLYNSLEDEDADELDDFISELK